VTRHPREMPLLKAVAEALHGSTDIGEALERTLGLVAGLLGLRTGWVWLTDPETNQFYVAAAQRLPPYLQEPVRMSGRWCLCTDLFSKGKLTPTNVDMLECSRLHPAIHAQDATLTQGLRYHATIPLYFPLYFRDRGLGIMNIAGPAWRALSEDELWLLSTIASQVGIAVERARLAEERTRLIRAEERARMAREIHDTLAQGLTAIGLDIEGALRHLEESPSRARDRLERALSTTRENLDEARRSVLDLRATELAGRPLAEALAVLGRAYSSETGVQVHVKVEDDATMSLRTEAELYRIAQEALSNVRQHAHATSVQISLRATAQSVLLIVADDGIGLIDTATPTPAGTDPSEPRRGHHGLVGMRERARLLGGRVRVTSTPGHGTRVSVRVPRDRDEAR
jgi:two-component system, NarL family, sensor kinase